VLFWWRHLISVVFGILWGILPMTGFYGFMLWAARHGGAAALPLPQPLGAGAQPRPVRMRTPGRPSAPADHAAAPAAAAQLLHHHHARHHGLLPLLARVRRSAAQQPQSTARAARAPYACPLPPCPPDPSPARPPARPPRVDEEEHGGMKELAFEGMAGALPLFLVVWTISYSTAQF
jgi:hypothetical protein